jgi:hypothetical protein
MAKRKSDTAPTIRTRSNAPAHPETSDPIEQRVIAFAEQLGRIVGTVQAKTEGWMDTEKLRKQISGVRDSAADLVARLSPATEPAAGSANKPAAARARSAANEAKGRSGGVVDAPGKKHRKPLRPGPEASRARSQAGKARAAKTTRVKATTRRGRG